MTRSAVVIPSTDVIVAMQIFERAPEPFEKEDSTLRGEDLVPKKRKESFLEKLWSFIYIILRPRKNRYAEKSRYDPVDYDRLLKVLNADDPMLISCCIDILYDMSTITARWRDGRRVFMIKNEAFGTLKKLYNELRKYVILG